MFIITQYGKRVLPHPVAGGWPDETVPRTGNPVRFYPALMFWKKLAQPSRARSRVRTP